MFKKEIPAALEQDKVATLIGRGTEIKGTLKASGGIRIDGRVDGEVNHEGDLVVGEEGVVEATVKTRNVTVAGEVRGNVEASGRVEIVSTGKLFGDIVVNALVIHEGALFDGSCQMRQGEGSEPRRRQQARNHGRGATGEGESGEA